MNDRARLKRILTVKEKVREARRAELARAEERRAEAAGGEAAALAEVHDLRRALLSPGEVSATDLIDRVAHFAAARAEHSRAAEALGMLVAERDRTVAAVADARREVRSLEVLDERLARDERRSARRREQGLQDEAAVRGGSRA
ncbi:MAG: hypothetical protein ACFCGT_07565 [Sandaracinaceae bacterium]